MHANGKNAPSPALRLRAFARHLSRRSFLFGAAGLPCAWLRAFSGSRFEFTQPHMGTEARIVLYAADAATAARASDAAFARIAGLDAALSDYRESSDLSRLCRQAGGPPVKVSDDLFRVLRLAQAISRRSNGAFDVTAGPLVRLWRRARRRRELPDPEELAAARALVGYHRLRLDESRRAVRLEKPGMQLDLGGIAKGFAADEALRVLAGHGSSAALVALGGDIVAGDPPPEKSGWVIAIAAPKGAPPAPRLLLLNAAVSTSGDAEQHVEIAGRRYSHIVDPRTGIGVEGQSSTTVVAPNGALADALATAANVLGPKDGQRLVDSFAEASALFFEAHQGRIGMFSSRRWDAIVKIAPERKLAETRRPR